MSASRGKRARQTGLTEGMDKKAKAAFEEEQKRRKSKTNYRIIGTLLVLFVLFVVAVNSTLFYNVLPAVKIGSDSYDSADFNYYYISSYTSFSESVGGSVSIYGLDTTLPFNEQECLLLAEGGTWADYFSSEAIASLKTVTAQHAAAVAAGHTTLREEDKVEIDTFMENYRTYAGLYNMTMDRFLAANFGRGTTEKSLRALLEKSAIGSAYAVTVNEATKYTDAELDESYQTIKDDHDTVELYITFVGGTPEVRDANNDGVDDEITAEETEAALAAAGETAAAIAAADTLDEFLTLAEELNGDTGLTSTSPTIASLPAVYAEWASDPARTVGDTFSVDATTGFYALYYAGRGDNSYNLVNVRHILIAFTDVDGDGDYNAEEMQTALDEAERLHAEWLAGEATEESFAELANLHSADPGSNTVGGLYENIYKGQMVAAFDAFCFEGHAPGDTDIVYGDSGMPGYHIIYFAGEGARYDHSVAEVNLRNAAYAAWIEELRAPYTVSERNLVLWFAKKDAQTILTGMLRS